MADVRISEGCIMAAKTKKFHILDVLSVTTGRLLSPRGMDGIYDILGFMTGEDLFTHQLPRASDVCKPYLLRRFPKLDSSKMRDMLVRLTELVNAMKTTGADKSKLKSLVKGWIDPFVVDELGGVDMLDVEALPNTAYKSQDPVEELVAMVGPDKVALVRV